MNDRIQNEPVVYAAIEKPSENFILIEWGVKKVGFGQITFCQLDNGSIDADFECMSTSFCKKIINDIVENVKFENEKNKEIKSIKELKIKKGLCDETFIVTETNKHNFKMFLYKMIELNERKD